LGIMLVVTAVNRKDSSKAKAVFINIQPMKNGEFLLDTTDVRETIFDAFGFNLEGHPIGLIDVARVEEVLEREPFILEAEVHVDALNVVHLELTQREPILRVMDEDGRDYYLDEHGEKLPPSSHYTQRVTVASGAIDDFDIDYMSYDNHNLKSIFNLTQTLKADEFWDAMIEQIYINRKDEMILVPKIGKQEILFGRHENVEHKLFNLRAFYEEAMPYQGWNKYQKIDVRYKGQVIGVK